MLPEGKARGRKPPPNGGVARPGRHRRGRHAGVGREREARVGREARRLEGARASGRGEENKERGRKKREEKGKKRWPRIRVK